MELVKSPVLFDRESHTYTAPGGRALQGITGMLSRQLFPDKYGGVPDKVLAKAAERGTMVHETLELLDEIGVEPVIPEAAAYRRIKEKHGLKYEASEYIVSDMEHFASPIDKVYRESEDSFTLADIKTTYELDEAYVTWQLNVYSYLFRLQNPGAEVARLAAIWLRGSNSRFVELGRIPDEEISRLLAAEAAIEKYIPSITVMSPGEDSLPARYAKIEDTIREIETQYKYWADKRKQLLDGVKEEMGKAGVKKWAGNTITFARSYDTVRRDFDKKKFALEHPDLYEEYMTEVPVSGRIILKV